MNTLIDNDEMEQDLSHRGHQTSSYRDNEQNGGDREISLGTTMILGIFFALALLCAVFFGFGYSLGAKHTPPAPTAAAQPDTSSIFARFKPAPGSPLAAAGARPAAPALEAPAAPETITVPYSAPTAALPAKTRDIAAATAELEESSTRPPAHVAAAPLPAVPGATSFVVQVAAVSHQEDADLIASTLKRRGYAVAIHQEPQDKLQHVQIGPFTSRKDAEAMRQRLLADGFNAYIK